MSRKTIQFKVPAAASEAPAAPIDRRDPGKWIAADLPGSAPDGAVEPAAAHGVRQAADAASAWPSDAQATRTEARSAPPEPAFAAGNPAREAVRMAFRRTERAVDRGIVWTLGLQALSREWLTLPLDAFRNGFDSLQLLGCRTPQDVVTVQSGLMWSGVEQVLARGDRIARISTQLAHEAGMPAPQAPVGDKG